MQKNPSLRPDADIVLSKVPEDNAILKTLREENVELRGENQELREENEALRGDNVTLHGEKEGLRRDYEALRGECETLKRLLSER